MNLKLSIIMLAILVTTVGCQGEKAAVFNNELVGKWITDDPRYQGLYFEITRNTIIFLKADGGLDSFPISQFSKWGGGKLSYNILYANRDGQPYKFEFFYESRGGGQIIFKNRPKMFWRKERS